MTIGSKIIIAMSAVMFSLSSVGQSYISYRELKISQARGIGFCAEFAFDHSKSQEETDEWMESCLKRVKGYAYPPAE
jgi:hypothetical protein